MELALCSADKAAAQRLAQMLRQWMFVINAVAPVIQYENQEAFFSGYHPGRFAFVFLDTEPDGLDIAHRMRFVGDKCQIAFVSSSQKQALACYAVHPAGFFLKPVRQAALYELLWWHRALFLPAMEYLTVLCARAPKKILLADIRYISVSGRTSLIHLAGEVVHTNRSLSELANQLRESGFFRCHRAHLVNPAHLEKLQGRKLLMDTGEALPVSEERLDEARRWVQMVEDARRS